MKKYFYTLIILLVWATIFLSAQAINIWVNSTKDQSTWYNTDIPGRFTVSWFTTFDWAYTWWSWCSKSCGPWTQVRSAYCRGSDGRTYSDSLCSWSHGATRKSCNRWPCGYPWSTCPSGMTITATITTQTHCWGHTCPLNKKSECWTWFHSSYSATPPETCNYKHCSWSPLPKNKSRTCTASVAYVLCSGTQIYIPWSGKWTPKSWSSTNDYMTDDDDDGGSNNNGDIYEWDDDDGSG